MPENQIVVIAWKTSNNIIFLLFSSLIHVYDASHHGSLDFKHGPQ